MTKEKFKEWCQWRVKVWNDPEATLEDEWEAFCKMMQLSDPPSIHLKRGDEE